MAIVFRRVIGGAGTSESRPLSRCAIGALVAMACAMAFALTSAAQAVAAEVLEPLAASPAPMTSVAANPVTGVIYAQENEGTRFYSYNPIANQWTELATAALSSENNGGGAYLNGKIYTSYTENSEKLGVYDIATNTWSTIANPLGEGTADIAAAGGAIYMAEEETLVKYDPATETTTPLANPPSPGFTPWGGLAYNEAEGKIYGTEGDGNTGFYVYDIASDEWTTLEETPAETVAGNALNPKTGTYFAYGGYGEEHLDTYDIASETWSESTLPFEVEDGGMAYLPLPGVEGVYMIQGEEGTGFVHYGPPLLADLSLSMAANVKSVTQGGEITYTLGVANAGPLASSNVTVTDTLPAGVAAVGYLAEAGSCSGTTTVTCALGNLAPGANATFTITVRATSPGTTTNTAHVSGSRVDPNPAGNSASVSTTVAAPTAVTPSCVVPAMGLMKLREAKLALKAAGCALGAVKHIHSRIPKGRVARQTRHQGKTVAQGTKVGISISRGPAKHHKKKHGHRKHKGHGKGHGHGKHKGHATKHGSGRR